MGWLRDLMAQSGSGCRSYGELARASLASGDWPAESRMEQRSLASIFSKLDRGQETEWLADRVGVQRVLAKVLGVALDDLSPPGVQRRTATQEVRRLRLSALRYARALDLVDEPLCPGVPTSVLTPGAYDNLLWRAPSGSGRSLVGHFLRARGLAHVVEADTLQQALAKSPDRGPLFIELHAPSDGSMAPPSRPGLCVAADFDARDPGWHTVHSPPVAEYLDELVAWVVARLPADGRFDPARTLEWLRTEMTESGVLDGLGAALGLCGLADEYGVHTLRGKSAQKLAERFCRDRLLAALDADAAHAAWLKRNGYDVLVGLGRRLLADSDAPWDQPRSLQTWLELVPLEHQREADLDWMRLSLSHSDSAIRPADIEKAARKIPPGAFRIVRALQRADFLRESAGYAEPRDESRARLSFGPRWFSNALRGEATRALIGGSPNDLGEALLKGHAASSLARELLLRLSDRGSSFIDGVLELEAGDGAQHIAALEMTFRAAGIALLEGAEISRDSLEALWDEAVEARLEFPDELPCPRIEYPEPPRDPLLARGTWYLAALSIGSELGSRGGLRHPLLRPWKSRAPDPRLREVCSIIARDLPADALNRSWALRAYSLIARLRAEIGALGAIESPEMLERPAVILDEVQHGVLSWATVSGISDDALGLFALQALASERGVPFSAVAEAIWVAWDDAQRPERSAEFLAPDSPHASWFWPHVPNDLLEALLCDARATSIPYESFGDAQWQAFLTAVDLSPARAEDQHAFTVAPELVLEQALERGIESAALFVSLWQRMPERAEHELRHALKSQDPELASRIAALLRSVGPSEFARVSELLRGPRISDLVPAQLHAVRHYLHEQVRSRKPGYPEAYARLAEIERQLARAR